MGIASSGTLVGGRRRSLDGDRKERDESEELDGESKDGVERWFGVGDGGWLVSTSSLELLASSLGLGAADTLGLGAGVDRTLYMPSVPIDAGVENGGLRNWRRKDS